MNSKTLALSAPILALAVLPSSALAAKAPPPPEVVLHIDASATMPPDQAKVTITLVGKGLTQAEAQADLAEKQKRLSAEASAMGIGNAQVEHGPVTPDPKGAVSYSAGEEAAMAAAEDAAAMAASDAAAILAPRGKGKRSASPAPKPVFVTAPTTITVNDVTKIDGLRAISEANGVQNYQFQRGVRFATSNPDAARKAAREAALSKARREADEYAASLGHKVVRIARVSNSSPPVSMGDVYGLFGMVDTMPERFMPSYYGATTSVSVAIDFVIAPN